MEITQRQSVLRICDFNIKNNINATGFKLNSSERSDRKRGETVRFNTLNFIENIQYNTNY